MTEIDFKHLDSIVSWGYYKDKLAAANDTGYPYVSEAMYKLHFSENKTLKQIAELLGYSHSLGVRAMFKKFNWSYRPAPHGGTRNFSKLHDHVETLRAAYKQWIAENKDPAVFCKEKAKEHKVHRNTVRVCVLNRTWKNKV